ncbi:hypothetical protein V6N13_149726 [Hibiscus sabdariffa]|uniref:Uncharacterized protein n=1 Tax=Hibiscus sabdariffa TaxID=183260 RepID=A0ABR2EHZ7_9ROSI
MGVYLATEVRANRGSNKCCVAPSYQGSLGSRNADKRDLTSTAGLGWTAQVIEMGLGIGTTYSGSNREQQFHHKVGDSKKSLVTATPTGDASGARRIVSAESQSDSQYGVCRSGISTRASGLGLMLVESAIAIQIVINIDNEESRNHIVAFSRPAEPSLDLHPVSYLHII